VGRWIGLVRHELVVDDDVDGERSRRYADRLDLRLLAVDRAVDLSRDTAEDRLVVRVDDEPAEQAVHRASPGRAAPIQPPIDDAQEAGRSGEEEVRAVAGDGPDVGIDAGGFSEQAGRV